VQLSCCEYPRLLVLVLNLEHALFGRLFQTFSQFERHGAIDGQKTSQQQRHRLEHMSASQERALMAVTLERFLSSNPL
jgi:hypothetical protein